MKLLQVLGSLDPGDEVDRFLTSWVRDVEGVARVVHDNVLG